MILTDDATVKDILESCPGMTLNDLDEFCSSFNVIDTEGEEISFEEKSDFSDKPYIDTMGLGIIPGGKSASSKNKLNKVAKYFAKKLRG